MPSMITPVASNDVNIVSAPIDGEGVTAASVIAVAQPLANTSAHILAEMASGALRIRKELVRGDLALLTGVANGDQRDIPGFGIYRFYTGSLGPANDPWVIECTGTAGWWIHDLADLVTGSPPIIPEIVASRIAASLVPNRTVQIVQSGTAGYGVATTTTSTSYVVTSSAGLFADVTGVEVGDLLIVQATFGLSTNAVAVSTARARLEAVDDFGGAATSAPLLRTEVEYSAADAGPDTGRPLWYSAIEMHTAAADGTTRIRFNLKGSGDTVSLWGSIGLLITHVRP